MVCMSGGCGGSEDGGWLAARGRRHHLFGEVGGDLMQLRPLDQWVLKGTQPEEVIRDI